MLGLSLTVIAISAFLFLGLGVFFYSIRMAVEPKDSEVIDPLPDDVE